MSGSTDDDRMVVDGIRDGTLAFVFVVVDDNEFVFDDDVLLLITRLL